MKRIDSHQHFWRLARGDYGWLTEQAHAAIHRDFLPPDLLPQLKDARIDKTILVQAAPTTEETTFLLDLAESTAFVAGVVGWVDFESPDAAPTIAGLAQHKKLVGLRPMLQDLRDDSWILSPQIAPAIDAMKKSGLRLDALIKLRHMPALEEFLRRNPHLPVVIDHGAKPDIQAGELNAWARGIRSVARSGTVSCKLSGLVTEAGSNWSVEKLKPYVDVLLGAFGPRRLMWGSDWPVLNEVSDYISWMCVAEALAGDLSTTDREAVFGGTAAAFYGIAS